MLLNKHFEEEFNEKGFLKFPFIPLEKLEKLRAIYAQFASAHAAVSGNMFFHASQDSLNYSEAKSVDDALLQLLRPEIEKHFEGYRLLIGSFLVKEPGEHTYLHPHQDWNFTDEHRFYSFNIWIPLDAIHRENGSLLFLPGSHKIIPALRPNFKYEWAFNEAADVIKKNFIEVTTEPGECVLINHAVIHASSPNLTNKPRVAVVIGMIPKSADIMHYFSDDAKNLEVYHLQREDLYDIKSGVKPPEEKKILTGEYAFPKASAETVTRWLSRQSLLPSPKKSILQDTSYQQDMDEQGFCLLQGIPQESIEKLRQLYEEAIKPFAQQGLHANHNRFTYEFNAQLSEKISALLQPFLDSNFKDCRVYIAHFMVKAPDTPSEMPLHQDWSIVDEQAYNAYQIWIPLQMVSPANGGLFVVPGSHRLFGNFRSGSLGLTRIPSDEHTQKLAIDLVTPPGSAVVYNNGLFHASYPNSTPDERVSVIVNVVQRDAPTYFFHQSAKATIIECYEMSGTDLLKNLPELEKGIVPASMKKSHEIAAPPFDNRALTSAGFQEAANRAQKEKPYAHLLPGLHILKLRVAEEVLHHRGYIQMPFLEEKELAQLQHLYAQTNNAPPPSAARYTTQEAEAHSKRKEIHTSIRQILSAKIESLFKDYKLPILQFFVKMPGTTGDIDFHTDSTLLLNPHLEPHYGLWIPLKDVDETNGTMVMVPGSHLWNKFISATSIPWHFFSSKDKWVSKSITLKIKAGEIVLFDNRIIHSSTFNRTEVARVSVAGRLTHRNSRYYSFFKENEEIRVFEEPDDYYQSPLWNTGGAPSQSGKFIGSMRPLLPVPV